MDVEDFYTAGAEMASEIEPSEKDSAFRTIWKTRDGEYSSGATTTISQAAAQRSYNAGWRDYKSGKWNRDHGGDLLFRAVGYSVIGYLLWRWSRPKAATPLATT